MTLHQFNAALRLTNLRATSKATLGAYFVLINGKTQQDAAHHLGCAQSTISKAVSKIKMVQQIAKHLA